MEFVILALRHVAVDCRGMDQHGCGRKPIIVLAELAQMLLAIDKFADEFSERFEHARTSMQT
jgi:hypothetical protein